MQMDVPKQFVYRHSIRTPPVARVNTHCNLHSLNIINNVLLRHHLNDRWEIGCFPHILKFSGQKQFFSGKLCINLLCREIVYPDARDDEMWFDVGGHAMRFGKLEFMLCTGLRFGNIPHFARVKARAKPESVHARYFGGQGTCEVDIVRVLEAGQFREEEDALKMAYVFVVFNVFIGKDDRAIVPNWLWCLVEDLPTFESFPWGTFIYSMTLHWLRNALTPDRIEGMRNSNHPVSKKSNEIGINIYGFIWALEVSNMIFIEAI